MATDHNFRIKNGLTVNGTETITASREGSFATRALFAGVDSTGNSVPSSADDLVVSGYGIIGNRNASVYLTNSDSNGSVKIGIGGAHNANPKLTVFAASVDINASLRMGSTATEIIDTSRNLKNIGTISSGAITSSGTIYSAGTITTEGNMDLRRNNNGDGVIIRDINWLNSFAQGSDDRVALIRANNSGGGADTRGGILTFFTRQPNSANFNSFNLDNAGTVNVTDLNASSTIKINGTTRINSVGDGLFTSIYIGSTNIVDTNRNLTNIGTISSGAITSSSTVSASGGNSSQWNTAYGWGNHASAGYENATEQTATNINNSGTDMTGLDDGWYKWGSTPPTDAPFNYGVMLQLADTNQKTQLAFGGSQTGKIAVRRADSGSFYDWANFWNEDNDGSGSGLDADLLDGVQGSSYLRSDSSDTASGQITFSSTAQYPVIIDASNNGKMVLRGSSSPYIRFQNGTTDQAFIQSTSSSLELKNQADSSSVRIKDDIDFSQDGTTYYSMWHEGNLPNASLAKVVKGTVTGVNNSTYVTAFTVVGNNLSSSIRCTFNGTSSSVVVNALVDLQVNHYQDILISSMGGFYTKLTIKVVSNNNEDYAVEIKHNGSTTTSLAVEVYPLNSETVTFATSHSYTGTTIEHVCEYGLSHSGTGGSNANIRTDGYMDPSDGYRVGGTTIVDSSRNLTNIGTISSGAITSSGNIGAASGHVSGKFAVKTSSVHASYDLYNNGTTYLNGATIIDDSLDLTGGSAALKVAGTTVIDSSRNLTNIGTISATSVGVTNIVTNKVVKFNGTILDDSNITDTGSAITLGSNTTVSGTVTATGATIGGNQTGTTLTIEASDTAGAPATTTQIEMIGYEGRGIGTFYKDVSYSGEEWFAGLQYGGDFNGFTIGYDASTGQAEYSGKAIARFLSSGDFQIGTTTVIDASRNLTNVSSIGLSGNITFGDNTTAGRYDIVVGSQTTSRGMLFAPYVTFGTRYSGWDAWIGSNTRTSVGTTNSGIELASSYTAGGASALNQAFAGLNWYSWTPAQLSGLSAGSALTLGTPKFSVTQGGDGSFVGTLSASAYYVGGTVVINSSRNLTNIGTITTSGNIGVNSTINLWNSSSTVAQVGDGTVIEHRDISASIKTSSFGSNYYRDTSGNYKALIYGATPLFVTSNSGNFIWYTSNSVSAGATSTLTEVMQLTQSGNLTASGNVTAYSDERLKSDIQTLDGSKVLKMRGVSFIKDGEAGSGVIAQELEKIAPELVHDGEYKSVAYGNLTGYLIEAIKEQQQKIEKLEERVERLISEK